MCDAYSGEESGNRRIPDENKTEMTQTPNFIMRDPEEPAQQAQEPQRTEPVYQAQEPQQAEPVQQAQEPQQAQPPYQAEEPQQQAQPPYPAAAPVYQEPRRKKKKSGGYGRKAAGIVAAALLFGVVAGGTMAGVNMLADAVTEETYPQVKQAGSDSAAEGSQEAPAAGETEAAQKPLPVPALDVSQIVEEAMPSVVAINNTMLYQSRDWFGFSQTYEVPSSGSGIIIGQNDKELLIVTNNHVIEDSEELSVVFIDETSADAEVRGTNEENDLAVIAVPLSGVSESTLSQISIARMGNSDELKVGQGVVAIGNALGYGQSVTVGYVSALNREVTTDGATTRNLLQTDAAINPGNSGGALLNMQGEVIGINAAKYSSTDVEGMGYAIPVSEVQDIIDSLMTMRSETVDEDEQGYLGIQGLTVDSSMVSQLGMPGGVFVYGIIEDGAASRSDLRAKDIITKFDGYSVRTMEDLQNLLQRYRQGETVELTVQRLENGEYTEKTVSIVLGAKAEVGQGTEAAE